MLRFRYFGLWFLGLGLRVKVKDKVRVRVHVRDWVRVRI